MRTQRQTVEVLPEQTGVYSIVNELRRYQRPMKAIEVAKIIGVSKDKFWKLVAEGTAPPSIDNGSRNRTWDPAVVLYWFQRRNTVYKQISRAA